MPNASAQSDHRVVPCADNVVLDSTTSFAGVDISAVCIRAATAVSACIDVVRKSFRIFCESTKESRLDGGVYADQRIYLW